ncbi:MAG: tetratricopeptide repeat protein [Deltaproteobacteria bacterium]|nr:tetratricopeptide repeat protein [Deltaproteobacteria bacterium]MBW1953488.1 tetratricopeptide repeat protein [Deltaproteobacteria bacterium]MBW1986347.1 tetratricopeptide repeat protein [Deltaproteobacteria bacterium]MBW2134389.1 tetratricopeptide repeat protein [Deltaproteobacteria bacterium]
MKKNLVIVGILLIVLACGQSSNNPTPEQLLQTGESHFKNQEYDQAIDCFQQVIQQEPRAAAAWNMLGMAYRFKYNKLRQPELRTKEIEAFKKAIEVDPKFWVAMINLGSTYYYQGEKAKAAPLFEKALELNPQHPEKAQLEKMVEEGRQQQ